MKEGVELDPVKVKAILEWEAPRTWWQLQSFLGFVNFYCQFIPTFAQIALPITNLLKTGKAWAASGFVLRVLSSI